MKPFSMLLAYALLKKKLYTEDMYQSEKDLISFKNCLLHMEKTNLSILFCFHIAVHLLVFLCK